MTLPLVDHRALLAKYIEHVGDSEGVDFLGGADWACRGHAHAPFTDAERAELAAIRDESDQGAPLV